MPQIDYFYFFFMVIFMMFNFLNYYLFLYNKKIDLYMKNLMLLK